MQTSLPVLPIIFELLAGVLLYATFCRLAKMDADTTLLLARAAYWLLAVCTAASLFAVPFWGFVVDWVDLALLTSFTVVQLVTSRAWKHGVPKALSTDFDQFHELDARPTESAQ